jgi:hypothetical protein
MLRRTRRRFVTGSHGGLSSHLLLLRGLLSSVPVISRHAAVYFLRPRISKIVSRDVLKAAAVAWSCVVYGSTRRIRRLFRRLISESGVTIKVQVRSTRRKSML